MMNILVMIMILNIIIDIIIDIIFVNLMVMYFLIESAVLCLGPPCQENVLISRRAKKLIAMRLIVSQA